MALLFSKLCWHNLSSPSSERVHAEWRGFSFQSPAGGNIAALSPWPQDWDDGRLYPHTLFFQLDSLPSFGSKHSVGSVK